MTRRTPVQPIIHLHRGTSLISRSIRWLNRSEYSHASITMPDGRHLESREGKGVICHPAFTLTNKTEEVDRFTFVRPLTANQIKRLDAFLSAQVGKPYDWPMVLGFISRAEEEGTASTGKWFCSELVFAGSRHAGRTLLLRIEPWEVNPGHISLSPLLRKLPAAPVQSP